MNKNAQTYLKVAALSIGAGSLLALIIKRKEIMEAIVNTWDKYTNYRLNKLHPAIREAASQFIAECERNGIYLRITSNGHLRTFEEQNELYAQGRTKPGKKVTWVKAGQSFHNYGLALDVVEIKDGKALWNNTRWLQIAAIAAKHGFEWGGNWKTPDKPHFQMTFGYKTNDLLAIYNAGQRDENGYVKLNAA
jgi:peptidoglycan L-alanyl-D-glutamate endopeptidase CwlK